MRGPRADSFTVEALGVHVSIRSTSEELLEALRQAWEGCLVPEPAQQPDQMVFTDVLTMDAGPLKVMERVSQEVTVQAIEARAGELLMLHACAVVDAASRRAVVLVGPSGMGKTTLAAELGQHWRYVTDETAGITPAGQLLAYPKPLSVIVDRSLPKRQFAPSELGLTAWREPSELAGLLLLDRRPGLNRATLQPVRTVPGVAMLAEHTSYLSRLERPLGRLATLSDGVGGLQKISYSTTGQVVPIVERILQVTS